MIKINYYTKLYNKTYGLGQDISQDLTNLVRVASIFVKDSNIHKKLTTTLLKNRVTDVKIREELMNVLSCSKIEPTHKQLVGTRTKREANSLVQSIFKGQGKRLSVVDWAATNYVSVTVAFGLIEFNRMNDTYYITELGIEAVRLLEKSDSTLNEFLLDRLLEYPYTAWMLRLVGKKPNQEFTKFDFGENFGFIDEAGFSNLPMNIYLDALAETYENDTPKVRSQLKSNYESTGEKYMRWLAGVLVDYGLFSSVSKKIPHQYNGKTYDLSAGLHYKITAEGLAALRKTDGKSSNKRTIKRVRWEYLAPKAQDAVLKKTSRALMLKYLSESKKGLSAQDIANKINDELPEINVSSSEVTDDICGLNRIGIEIVNKKNLFILEDSLFDFEIPIQTNKVLVKSDVDTIKDKVRVYLKSVNHRYLKTIDIAFKKKTTNMENTEFELLSTELFTNELGLKGKHMGGSGRPDGIAYNDTFIFILDSKAYSKGFPLTKKNTDPMLRYLVNLKERNLAVKPHWWKEVPKDIKNTYFIYISGSFTGKYEQLLQSFKDSSSFNGGALEIIKLLLLSEDFKNNKIDINDVKNEILDSKNIAYDTYHSHYFK